MGASENKKLMEEIFAGLANRNATLLIELMSDDFYVIVEARGDNVTKAGKPYNNEYCFVFRLSDGKIKEVKEYSDTALVDAVLGDPAALAAAG